MLKVGLPQVAPELPVDEKYRQKLLSIPMLNSYVDFLHIEKFDTSSAYNRVDNKKLM